MRVRFRVHYSFVVVINRSPLRVYSVLSMPTHVDDCASYINIYIYVHVCVNYAHNFVLTFYNFVCSFLDVAG